MSAPLQALLLAVFGIVLSAIIAAIVRIYDRLLKMELALSRLDTQVSPLWAKVQAQIAADLHHPHPRYAEMDTLLERLEALSITLEERTRLKELLRLRAVDFHEDITEDQRRKANLMIMVMDAVLSEQSGSQ